MKKIVIIGASGAGKSTLCNVLSGRPPGDGLFPVSQAMAAGTFLTTTQQVQFVGSNQEVALIDTPGLNDPEGKDSEHIVKMVATLRKEKTVNSFVIVFNGQYARMDQSLKKMLLLFQKMFGEAFLENTIFEFSRWCYDKNSVRVRQMRGQTEDFWSKELNLRLREAGLNVRDGVPAIFVDSLHDSTDEEEKNTFEAETKKLLNFINNCKAYSCSEFEVTKTVLDDTIEQAEQAEKDKVTAIASLQTAREKEEKENTENLQMSARSTTECAMHFITELKIEENALIGNFQGLLGNAMKHVHNVAMKIDKENNGEAETTIQKLTVPIVKMSESVKLCLKNVKKQDQLINNESYFYTIRETKYRDDKTKAESEVQRAKLNVAQTKTEIGLAKEKIAQAESGAEEARLAVEEAERTRNETLGWGVPLAILFPPAGVPALTAALVAAQTNLNSALQSQNSAKNVLPVLENIGDLWTSFFQDQEKEAKHFEKELNTINVSISRIKEKQKTITDLMERVKNQLSYFAILDGKGNVLKNVSAGSLLLKPILSVMLDLLLYIQGHQEGSQAQNWQQEIDSVTKAMKSADALPLGYFKNTSAAVFNFDGFV